jgi:hypothetical protein
MQQISIRLRAKLRNVFGDVDSAIVRKIDLANSRPDRFESSVRKVSEAREEFETLREELETWYDSLPDSFQQGDQGENMQAAMDRLQEIHDELDKIDFSAVEFPGMRT